LGLYPIEIETLKSRLSRNRVYKMQGAPCPISFENSEVEEKSSFLLSASNLTQ
jgi:hypothetical protein